MAKGDDIEERLIDCQNLKPQRIIKKQLVRRTTVPTPSYAEARSAV